MIKISQSEVLTFLEAHREKEYTSTELAKELNVSSGSITTNLAKLWKHQDVSRRKSWKLHHNQYLYKLAEEKE